MAGEAIQDADFSPVFEFIEFNERRAMRGAPAARVQVADDGEWLWMGVEDIRANMQDFGVCEPLQKALSCYEKFGGVERPVKGFGVRLELEITHRQAYALAEFVKRLEWHEMRLCASSDTECFHIQDGIEAIAKALRDAGMDGA